MKNLLKLAALIISTTVLSYAGDTPDLLPLAGEDHQQHISFVSPTAQDALNQEALRISTLEERVQKHQELDSNPEDLATLKNDVKSFRFSDALAQYYQDAQSSQRDIKEMLDALTDKDNTNFGKRLANSGVYTQEALPQIDAFIHHLDTLKTQTTQFINNVNVLRKKRMAIQSVFPETREDSRETSLKDFLALLAIREIIGGGQNFFTEGTTIIIPMGRSTSSNNQGCGNCPSCLLKKAGQQASTRNPENTEKKSSDEDDSGGAV